MIGLFCLTLSGISAVIYSPLKKAGPIMGPGYQVKLKVNRLIFLLNKMISQAVVFKESSTSNFVRLRCSDGI